MRAFDRDRVFSYPVRKNIQHPDTCIRGKRSNVCIGRLERFVDTGPADKARLKLRQKALLITDSGSFFLVETGITRQ